MYNTAISKLTSFESDSDLIARLDKGDVLVLPVAAPTLAVLSAVSPLPDYKISHAENVYKQATLFNSNVSFARKNIYIIHRGRKFC